MLFRGRQNSDAIGNGFSQERSLSTILYLMSMTEHARAPFSLVDEINQVCDLVCQEAGYGTKAWYREWINAPSA
jgi:hypothetical protein